jgi:hypothetical protein
VTTAAELRGLIMDWGGVLTSPILTTVRAWIEADEIDWETYRLVMKTWLSEAYDIDGGPNPVYALERGECTPAEFEQPASASPAGQPMP